MTKLQKQLEKLSVDAKYALATELGLVNDRQQLLAYYTSAKSTKSEHANSEMPEITSAIQKHLAQHLPAHMVPSHVIHLDKLPSLANGKVDIKNLPAPDSKIRCAQTDNVATGDNNNSLALLISTLEQLLGFDGIREDDNFFELGGDSITAIRFVSKAREAGISISVADVANAATMATLAQCDGHTQQEQSNDTPTDELESIRAVGDSVLTPIQRWFFAQNHPKPAVWNIGAQFYIEPALNSQQLINAVLETLAAEPALFARFTLQADGNVKCYYPTSQTERHHQLTQCITTVPQSGDAYVNLITHAANTFNLESGQLIGISVETDEHHQAVRLNLVLHHLIADQLSLQTLLQHLDRCLSMPTHTSAAQNSVSIRQWAWLCDQVRSENGMHQEPARLARSAFLTVDKPQAEIDTLRIRQSVSAEITTDLLHLCKESNVPVCDALVFALANIWRNLTGEQVLPLDIETHGRDLFGDAVFTAESIGWFSSYYPADVELSDYIQSFSVTHLQSTSKRLQQTKQTHQKHLLFAHENTGADYDHPNARILLNYFGHADRQASQTNQHSVFTPCLVAEPDALRAPENFRAHNLELNVFVDDQKLVAHFAVPKTCMSPEQLSDFSQSWKDTLTTISTMQSAYPDVEMNQSELDDFLDSLE